MRGAPTTLVLDGHGREVSRAVDVEAADGLEVLLGVDLDVAHARHDPGDVGEHAAGGAAGRAEGGGELQQREPLPQLQVEAGGLDGARLRLDLALVGAGDAMGAAEATVGQRAVRPERERGHDSDDQHPGSGVHARDNARVVRVIP